MERFITTALALILLTGCGEMPPAVAPVCFPFRGPDGAHSVGEQKALVAATQRLQTRCHRADTQCDFRARSTANNDIAVVVEFARLYGDPPKCGFAPGDHETQVYSMDGAYVRTIPGL